MEYLAINRLTVPPGSESFSTALGAHLQWVRHNTRSGTIVRAGRWGEGGMCIVEARDEHEATAIVASDPLVSRGLVDVTMAAIEPAVHAPG